MSNEASVGLRVWLQDDFTEGMIGIGDIVLETAKTFNELKSVANSTFESLIDGSIMAGEALSMLTSFATQSAGSTGQAATATEDLSSAQTQAAQSAKEETVAIETLNEITVNLRQNIKQNITVTDDMSQATVRSGNAAQDAGEKHAGFAHQIMALMLGKQVIDDLVTTEENMVMGAGDMEYAATRAGLALKATGDDTSRLSDEIVRLGNISQFTNEDVASTFELIGERAYNTSDVIDGKLGESIVKLAQVTGSDLTEATEDVTIALKDFNLKASDSSYVASAFAFAAENGIPKLEGLQSALERVGPSAAGLGVDFNTLISMLIYLSQHGFPDVNQAGTGLNYLFQALAAPTSTAGQALKDLGISAYDSAGNLRDYPSILQDLMQAMAKLPNSEAAEQFRSIFNIRSGQVARVLALDPNVKGDLEKIISEISSSSKSKGGGNLLDKQFAILSDQFKQKFDTLQGSFTSFLHSIAIPVLGFLKPILDWANNMIGTLSKAGGPANDFAQKLALIGMVAAPLIAITLGVGMFIAILGAAAGPVALIVAGIALVAAGAAFLWQNWNRLFGQGTVLNSIFHEIVNTLGAVWHMFAVQDILKPFQDAWKELQPPLMKLLPVLGGIAAIIGGVLVGAISGLIGMIGPLARGIAMMWGGALTALAGILNVVIGIVKFFINVFAGVFALFRGDKLAAFQAFGKATDGLKQALGGLGQFIKGLFQSIWGLISGVVGGLVGLIAGFVQGIISWFTHLWNILVGHSIVPDLVNAILGLFAKLVSFGKALIQLLVNGVIAIFNLLIVVPAKTIGQFIANIGSALANGGKAVGGWVGDHIINPIRNAINNLINMGRTWGSNFINMLRDGIMAGINGILNAVGNIANGIKNMLGFHSPPKEGPLADSDEYMGNMMSMYATGIMRHAHLVHGAVNHVASGIATGINTPLVSRLQLANVQNANLANGQQNTTINLNVDGKTVGTAVFNHLTGQMQLNGLNRAWR